MHIRAGVSSHCFPSLFCKVRAHPMVMLLCPVGYIACIMFVCWSSERASLMMSSTCSYTADSVLVAAVAARLLLLQNVCNAPPITIDMQKLLFFRSDNFLKE